MQNQYYQNQNQNYQNRYYPNQSYPSQGYPNQYNYPVYPVYPQHQMSPEEQKKQFYINKRKKEANEILVTGLIIGATLIAQLFIPLFLMIILSISPYYSIYEDSSLFQNTFNIIATHIMGLFFPFLIMSRILKKRYTCDLIPREKLPAKQCFAWICAGLGLCIIANYITSFVISLFDVLGYKLTQTEYTSPASVIDCIAIVFSTALAPAVIEEFAMRCCTMGALRKYGKGFAVFAVSVIFGLIHGNVIQFVFAFLLGLVFGYVTIVTDSVVPAMFIHGLNNGMSVVQDIVTYAAGEDMGSSVLVAFFILWFALGIWGIIHLARRKLLIPKREKKEKEPYALSFFAKMAYMLPGLLIPIGILIYITTQTVVPK